jgi:CRISPR-associated protein Cmr3
MRQLFIEPVDVLYLRGNRLFGAAGGDHAEPLMPPWPSVFAGAIRSRMLTDYGVPLATFTEQASQPPAGPLGEALGVPTAPGTFRLGPVALGHDETGSWYVPCPADLIVASEAREDGVAKIQVHSLEVEPDLHAELRSSSPLPSRAVLRTGKPFKPDAGYWMNAQGLRRYLNDQSPLSEMVVRRDVLWRTDPRLGTALEPEARTVAAGKLYTTEVVAMASSVGFVVGVDGVADELLPREGLVRLGGDGRGAAVRSWESSEPPCADLSNSRGVKVMLASPGIFPDGWLLPGFDPNAPQSPVQWLGCTVRLVAAAVPRFQTVSGWDVALHRPKPAQRAVPTGSVYWLELVDGDAAKLQQLQARGLWGLQALSEQRSSLWQQRRAEGFNNVWIGRWSPEGE